MIKLTEINKAEAVRYLGGSKVQMNEAMENLLTVCESEVIAAAEPKYLYKKIPLKNSGLLIGDSVKSHLKNCENAFLLCVTIGAKIDKLIRYAEVSDMAKAVVLDALSSCAVEQVCEKLDTFLSDECPEKYLTYRFSPGYGDYPIELQKKILDILDAPKKIGLCTNENSLLTPSKSVTAIIGISETEIEKRRRGCVNCNLKESCKYRKTGERCEF